jgi:hypothetical protein
VDRVDGDEVFLAGCVQDAQQVERQAITPL